MKGDPPPPAAGPRLTGPQRALLDGKAGPMVQRLMRLLFHLGRLYGASEMVAVRSVQVSGVSYQSLGEPGLAFLEEIAASGARASVLTVLNPAGMDLEDWRELGTPESFARRQKRVIAAFEAMGATITATCTPYLAGVLPRFGEHLAWAESSAVSFANAVLGARTNREGGPAALAAAICGCTPRCGLHLDESRRPTVRVDVAARIAERSDFGALGWFVGRELPDAVPYFRGLDQPRIDDLKALGAAMAASGAVALYHVEGATPEAARYGDTAAALPRFGCDESALRTARQHLDQADADPELIVIGCPHASLQEIADVAAALGGRQLDRPLWVCTARPNKVAADRAGLTAIIERAGGRVVADTCPVVAPLQQLGWHSVAVDSAKAASYLPGLCGQRVSFASARALIERALR